MVQCLDILSTQTENKELAKIIANVKDGVQGGSTLSDAMARHPKIFDQLYTNMVEAGEIGGALDAILVRLAVYREKADQLIRKVKGAMVYPTVVMIVAMGVTFAMLTFIVPVFAKMFEGVGADLPAPTKVVMDISEFSPAQHPVTWGWDLIALIIVPLSGGRRTPQGALLFDKFLLRTPVFGNLGSQIVGGPVYPHAVHVAGVGCIDSRGAGDHGEDRGQPGGRERHQQVGAGHRRR